MNTPVHVLVNVALLDRARRQAPAVIAGAMIPDVAGVVFVAVETMIAGRSGERLWDRWHSPAWAAFLGFFHSFVVASVILLIAHFRQSPRATAFGASYGLHVLCDVPVHHEDAHAYFFPLSDWRFVSPFSYWDPAHGARVVIALEAVVSLVAGWVVFRRYESTVARIAVVAILLGLFVWYGSGAAFWGR